MLVLNMGETDSSRVPMATDGPDVTDEGLLARLGLRRHSLALSKIFKSVLLEIAFGELYLQ
jgi:hypothetical protein